MDEFVGYHPLACATAHLTREFNVYRERCGSDDLTPPLVGRPLPLRSYTYIGSLPALVFVPFWAALRAPVAARIQGACFLVATLVLVVDALEIPLEAALLALLALPLVLGSFLVDTGPVGLSLVAFTGALALLRRALSSAAGERRAMVLAALAGLLLFAGLWTKLVFAWCLPAAALLALEHARRCPRPRALKVAVIAALALAIPAAFLLLARDASGHPYLEVLRLGRFSAAGTDIEQEAEALSRHVLLASTVSRNVILPPSWIDLLPVVAAAVVIALATRRGGAGMLLPLLATIATAAATMASTRAWAPHHAVYTAFLLSLVIGRAVGALGSRRLTLALAAVVALHWGSLAWRWPQARVEAASGADKDRVLDGIRAGGLDARTVQVHVSWGTFYIAELFGDRDRIVLFSRRLGRDERLMAEARTLADARGRGLLIVTRHPDRLDPPGLARLIGPRLGSVHSGPWAAIQYLR